MPRLTLITGGARSGKSTFALSCIQDRNRSPVFIATAEAMDDEMRERIRNHQAERTRLGFRTIEEPIDITSVVTSIPETEAAILDCLTVWLGNLYHHLNGEETRIRKEIDDFVAALPRVQCDLVLVTNEVGWGIVPENAIARSFRDMAGMLNRRVAEVADEVVLCVCGVPVVVKKKK